MLQALQDLLHAQHMCFEDAQRAEIETALLKAREMLKSIPQIVPAGTPEHMVLQAAEHCEQCQRGEAALSCEQLSAYVDRFISCAPDAGHLSWDDCKQRWRANGCVTACTQAYERLVRAIVAVLVSRLDTDADADADAPPAPGPSAAPAAAADDQAAEAAAAPVAVEAAAADGAAPDAPAEAAPGETTTAPAAVRGLRCAPWALRCLHDILAGESRKSLFVYERQQHYLNYGGFDAGWSDGRRLALQTFVQESGVVRLTACVEAEAKAASFGAPDGEAEQGAIQQQMRVMYRAASRRDAECAERERGCALRVARALARRFGAMELQEDQRAREYVLQSIRWLLGMHNGRDAALRLWQRIGMEGLRAEKIQLRISALRQIREMVHSDAAGMTPAETDEWLQHNQVFELVFGERMPVEKESYMESAQQLLKARRFAWPFASSGAETACGAV